VVAAVTKAFVNTAGQEWKINVTFECEKPR
jgi:hypothetical protein